MEISRLMRKPVTVTSGETLAAAAALMHEHDVGSVAVMEGSHIVGVLTDRDIVIGHVAADSSTRAVVQDVMTPQVVSCPATASVEEVAATMGDYQVRRLVICDDAGRLVGIVSVGDIAKHYSEHLAGETLGEIVEFR
ncbi:CBS domain-containing protein [Fodinicurvata sp. EGI_FJ10296]|uniref:CBS domain-containing protein n=1 Tax=Fodinicurvata sp. EGI_FJ10296 TaxID=3231908 RepID=UPI0034535891